MIAGIRNILTLGSDHDFRIVPIFGPSIVVGPMGLQPCGLPSRLARAELPGLGLSLPHSQRRTSPMVRALIKWSLHNRFIVLLATIGLIAIGAYSANNLNVEAYPDPTPPLVEVITQNHGMSPEEMEKLIGIPLETALNGMPGLKYLRSISLAGLNDIKCQFEYGTDYWTGPPGSDQPDRHGEQPACRGSTRHFRRGARPVRSSVTF